MYVVITRKLRASMEPFWDLKLCVEYLTHVSSEYITSWVLLSLTSTAGRTSRILVADVIPWINKASLALYARTLSAMPRPTRWMAPQCRVCRLWLEIISIEVESQSQTPSPRLRHQHQCGLDCVRTILTTFYHIKTVTRRQQHGELRLVVSLSFCIKNWHHLLDALFNSHN